MLAVAEARAAKAKTSAKVVTAAPTAGEPVGSSSAAPALVPRPLRRALSWDTVTRPAVRRASTRPAQGRSSTVVSSALEAMDVGFAVPGPTGPPQAQSWRQTVANSAGAGGEDGELHVDEPEPPPSQILHASSRILRPPSPPQSLSPVETTQIRQSAGAGPSQQAAEDSDYASEYETITRV